MEMRLSTRTELTAERLREVLHYDPLVGVFTWKARVEPTKMKPGQVAGWVEWARRRITIEIDQHNYRAHRLAWLYVHGVWPAGVIDHINGDSLDNRIANLRDTSQLVNVQNIRVSKNSASGLLGAFWVKSRRHWRSSIRANGKVVYLGQFHTPEEAHAAYVAAKRRLHEGCTI